MNYLLDTNVVSELVKPRPNERVVRWIAEVDEDRTFLSVMTFTEIRQGIEQLGLGPRREGLRKWIDEDVPERFAGRIMPVDLRTADACGVLLAQSRKNGMGLGVVDALFAASALANQMTLVTRNTRHFAQTGVELHDPWTG